jgi:hypothetical protein
MAEWPDHEFGLPPSPPKGLNREVIDSNKFWNAVAQGYNPLALFAIAAIEVGICGYVYYTGKPLWYAPAAFAGMIGAYAAYITYYYGKDEFMHGVEKDINDITGAYKKGKKEGTLMLKYSPYIITAAVGLTITGLVIFETANELGSAGSEIMGVELLAGICITGVVEAGLWLSGEANTLEDKLKIF